MVKRKGEKYVLTPFGEVIYSVQLEFDEAVDDRLKSKVEMPIIISLIKAHHRYYVETNIHTRLTTLQRKSN